MGTFTGKNITFKAATLDEFAIILLQANSLPTVNIKSSNQSLLTIVIDLNGAIS